MGGVVRAGGELDYRRGSSAAMIILGDIAMLCSWCACRPMTEELIVDEVFPTTICSIDILGE